MPGKTKKRRLLRWCVRITVALVLLLLIGGVAGWIWGQAYAQDIIQAKLQRIVSGHLNAQLEIGDISYSYPFGVTVEDAALVAEPEGKGGPTVTLASFKQLRLQLKELPFGEGPLKIQSIEVDEPTVHVIRTPEGFVGQTGLVKSDEQRERERALKLSEVFELHRLAILRGRIQYEDRRPGIANEPMVWQGLNIVIDTQANGPSHTFKMAGNTGDLARIESSGTLDLDTLILSLEAFRIRCEVKPHQSASALPPEVATLLTRFDVRGRASLDVSGNIPLKSIMDGKASLTFIIEDGRASYPGFNEPLQDLDIQVSAAYADTDLNVKLERLDARSGSTGLSVQPFNVLISTDDQRWTASTIRAAAAYVPTEATRSILAQPATLFIAAAPLQLGNFDEIGLQLDGSSLSLPNLNDELKLTSRVDWRAPIATVQPSSLTGLGGRVEFNGTHDLDKRLTSINTKALGLSMASLKAILNPQAEREMRGRLTGEVAGTITNFDQKTLNASGVVRVSEARFASVPVFTQIAEFLRIGTGLFVAERAYARFNVRNESVRLERVAVSSNAVRIRGEGKVGFDESLDLSLYIVGSGDWGKGLKQTGIPVVSDVAGLLAGSAQSIIRGVTTQFTSMKVTGTVSKPRILPDPAPIITDPIKKLFETAEEHE